MNGLALIAVSIYLVSVSVNSRSSALLNQLKQDKGFLKWAVALFILMKIGENVPSLKNYDLFIISGILIGIEDKSNGISKLLNQLSEFVRS